jgi:hypothetical protein
LNFLRLLTGYKILIKLIRRVNLEKKLYDFNLKMAIIYINV